VKQTHCKSPDLQPLAAATEDGNVSRVRNAVDDAVDIAVVDALNRAAEIADGAREQIPVG
jgi:hypothetical protein